MPLTLLQQVLYFQNKQKQFVYCYPITWEIPTNFNKTLYWRSWLVCPVVLTLYITHQLIHNCYAEHIFPYWLTQQISLNPSIKVHDYTFDFSKWPIFKIPGILRYITKVHHGSKPHAFSYAGVRKYLPWPTEVDTSVQSRIWKQSPQSAVTTNWQITEMSFKGGREWERQ
jgi:hypothetical protein